MVPSGARHPACPSVAALPCSKAQPSPGAVRSHRGTALGMIPVQEPSERGCSLLPGAAGLLQGRAEPSRARLPRPHTVHVMPEEIGSTLGRKLKQGAPRSWSTPHPCAPRGTPAPRTHLAPFPGCPAIPAGHQGWMDTRARLRGVSVLGLGCGRGFG